MCRLPLALLLALVPVVASAQEDVTAPVLQDFTIAPGVFDAGIAETALDVCITAQDDLSGLGRVIVGLNEPGRQFFRLDTNFGGTFDATLCGPIAVPRFFAYRSFYVIVAVFDEVGNAVTWSHPVLGEPNDLCSIGTCEVVNRPSGDLPDTDNDTIPDDADNCPDDPNTGQEDGDLDLIGDICDPFPDDRDNEQAQCETDFENVLVVQFGECSDSPILPDDDEDDVLDTLDNCVGTANADQLDTNDDGYGNACDPDVTNDGTVTSPDFVLFSLAFGTSSGDLDYNADADFTGDGRVESPDFVQLVLRFGEAPGPSGLYCAGKAVGCPALCAP